jgi:hypothetical protein
MGLVMCHIRGSHQSTREGPLGHGRTQGIYGLFPGAFLLPLARHAGNALWWRAGNGAPAQCCCQPALPVGAAEGAIRSHVKCDRMDLSAPHVSVYEHSLPVT